MQGLNQTIKRLRKENNLTQAEFSEIVDVHLQTVSKWERGLTEPDIMLWGEIADCFKVTLEKLLGEEETSEVYSGKFSAVALGKAISEYRKEIGKSQEEFGEMLFTTADTVSRWERGISCPSLDDFIKLCHIFGVSVSKLYYGIQRQTIVEERSVFVKKKKIYIALIAALSVFSIISTVIAIVAILRPTELPMGGGKTYTVTIGDEKYSVNPNQNFTPTESKKEGYDLVGYSDQYGNTITFPCKITQDSVFEPIYELHVYKVDYWLNGGHFEDNPQMDFTVDDSQIELKLPQKEGDTFEGWYLTPDYSGESVSILQLGLVDIDVYAKWGKVVYAIKYDLSGGTLTYENPSTPMESDVKLYQPIRQNHVFCGWYSGDVKYDEIPSGLKTNLKLTAKWERSENTYSVTYDLCGGEMEGENPYSIKAGEEFELIKPQMRGYDFLGWCDTPDGNGNYYEILSNLRSNVSLYAVYRIKTYKITLSYIDVQSVFNPQLAEDEYVYLEYGESYTLPIPDDRWDFKYLGWYSEDDNAMTNILEINKENIVELSKVKLKPLVLPRFFTVNFDGNGGMVKGSDGTWLEKWTNSIGVTGYFNLPEVERAGYKFVGWCRTQDGKGEYYSDFWDDDDIFWGVYLERVYQKGDENPTCTLYAIWEKL